MRRRFGRSSFRRHGTRRGFRRRVSWLTDINQRGEDLLAIDDLNHISLTHVDNDFVENHPRFAKRNDVVGYRRIVGELRVALYNNLSTSQRNEQDYLVEYGIAFVPGTYDNAGVWSPGEYPDPRETGDEDEKWVFKNRAFLSFGAGLGFVVDTSSGGQLGVATFTGTGDQAIYTASSADALSTTIAPTLGFYTQQARPHMLSTDEQLPSGSKVDISTRRKAQYGEKLHILAYVTTEAPDTENVSVFMNWQLRVLVNG